MRTAGRVAERLCAAGWRVRTGVGGHGLVADLGQGEPCIAFRADMDALPLQETTGLPWASSVPGVMHACGHDFHTAWLLGLGLVLTELGLPQGTARLLFQPAEETLGGAERMIAQGALEDPAPAVVVGAHVWPGYPAGQVGLRPGHNLASADRFTVTLRGAGTHGALPHLGADPIPAAAELVLALQARLTRQVDPLQPVVLSVCQIHAGTAFNIIPAEARLAGTVRSVAPADRALIQELIRTASAGIAQAHGLAAEVEYELGVPPTVADPAVTARARQALATVLPTAEAVVEAESSMGAEDFAYFLERVPGALLWVGCGPEDPGRIPPRLHDPCFVGSEACLETAMLALAAIAGAYLTAP